MFFIIFIYSCENNKSKAKIVENSPYEIFFNQLKINKLTDTILVQNRTKIFGCGTAYSMYEDELNKNGVFKFYEKYGTVLDNSEFLNLFAKNNNVEILWIERGNEGGLFQLEDSFLHKNKNLEKRLIAEKTFLSFDDRPKSLDSLSLTVLINFRNFNKTILKSFDLSNRQNNWKIDKQNEQEIKSYL
jgi:hypothetical protein